MRILIQNKDQRKHKLYVPNILLLNRLTSFLITKVLEKRKVHLPYKQIRLFAKDIKTISKRHPDWVLVEAEKVSGEKIKIIL